MLFYDRSDGRRVRTIRPFNAMIPYLMRGRNASAIYFEKELDVENAVRYVHRKNAEPGNPPYTLFGIILTAVARTLLLKPHLNRFVHRRGVYQHDRVSLSFVVKKRISEEATEANAKICFDPSDTLPAAMAKIADSIARAREETRAGLDDLVVKFSNLVPGGKALITGLLRLLDRFNLLPAFVTAGDPLFTSIYFANLGSIGLDAPFHHLFEWGTASVFAVIGRMYQKEARGQDGKISKRHFVDMKITIDERISEGVYFAHAAALFQRLLSHPELLEEPSDLGAAET
jgi:hypothetical protein